MSDLSELDQRLSRKSETGRGIHFMPQELDLLVTNGACAAFREAFAAQQTRIAQEAGAGSRPSSDMTASTTSRSSMPPFDPTIRVGRWRSSTRWPSKSIVSCHWASCASFRSRLEPMSSRWHASNQGWPSWISSPSSAPPSTGEGREPFIYRTPPYGRLTRMISGAAANPEGSHDGRPEW